MKALLVALTLAGQVPLALTNVAELAEDLYDARDHVEASRLVVRLDTALTQLAADFPAKELQAPRATLAEARRAVERGDVSRTRIEANRLCAWAVERLGPYLPLRVIGPQRLDLLLRDVQIAADAGAVDRAAPPLAEARGVWRALTRLPALAASPARIAFDRQLDAIEASITGRDLPRLAAATAEALEGVDALEAALAGPVHVKPVGSHR